MVTSTAIRCAAFSLANVTLVDWHHHGPWDIASVVGLIIIFYPFLAEILLLLLTTRVHVGLHIDQQGSIKLVIQALPLVVIWPAIVYWSASVIEVVCIEHLSHGHWLIRVTAKQVVPEVLAPPGLDLWHCEQHSHRQHFKRDMHLYLCNYRNFNDFANI